VKKHRARLFFLCAGAVTQDLAWLAQDAGAAIHTNAAVEEVLVEGNTVKGVRVAGGQELRAPVVLANVDPFSLLDLLPSGTISDEFRQQTHAKRMDGLTMKVMS
jgi:phytoene dehydrogenase-like protein